MKGRYNIAFLPVKNQTLFIELAKAQALLVHPDTYCLSASSFPHVSLCHFIAEEKDIHEIWRQVYALRLPKLRFLFRTLRCTTHNGRFWISLMPNHLNELKSIHLKIADIIKHPLNRAYEHYYPHLSLLNSKEEAVDTTLCPPIEEDFQVSLGRMDTAGQITQILFEPAG